MKKWNDRSDTNINGGGNLETMEMPPLAMDKVPVSGIAKISFWSLWKPIL